MIRSKADQVTEHHYFAYGSNMSTDRMTERGMRFDGVEGAVLSGYRLAFNKRSLKFPGTASANVIVAIPHSVEGVVYRLADEKEIFRMDPYEGYPVRYNRQLLQVLTTSGAKSDAWVYIAKEEFIDDSLRPARWYLAHLLAGKPYLSEAYFEWLKTTPCLDE